MDPPSTFSHSVDSCLDLFIYGGRKFSEMSESPAQAPFICFSPFGQGSHMTKQFSIEGLSKHAFRERIFDNQFTNNPLVDMFNMGEFLVNKEKQRQRNVHFNINTLHGRSSTEAYFSLHTVSFHICIYVIKSMDLIWLICSLPDPVKGTSIISEKYD